MSRFDVNRARGSTQNSDVSSLGSFVPLLREYLRFLRVRLRGPCRILDERWRVAESCGCKLGLAVEPEIRLFCFSVIRNVFARFFEWMTEVVRYLRVDPIGTPHDL